MKRYLYNYQTIVDFADAVINHSILLRCQPVGGAYMSIDEEHVIVSPGFWTKQDIDAYGNRIIYGGDREPHKSLAYVSMGLVTMGSYLVAPDRIPLFVYRQPTRLTSLASLGTLRSLESLESLETLNSLNSQSSPSPAEIAQAICHDVNAMLEYTPGATSIDTPAAEVYNNKKGVCQDYAHLMIALCRQVGLAARYACGFVEGTGETHAWVEVFDGYNWIGFDPTCDRRIVYGYVKLAHGRDAADCPVSRGIYARYTSEQTQINVTLKEL